MHTFQNMILQLTNFWANHGCLFHQCYDLETGAATFNPITFLKVLGPEPYKAAYVEPCRRPQDGRYGQNPNRLQLFHQFQVILKPSPENVLDLYLKSLEAIGFDLSKHDIRFVHDDWESPTLGAWGLGWEVWIDGMEVTQFTYFQSVAGYALKPVTAEIAYGLERLSMLLQNKNNLFDMKYNKHLTYKDVVMQNEIEWSTYNFEKSDPKLWLDHFNEFEKEAKRLVECKLSIPAYDFVIKASHAFNMLEARGVISTTERTGYIFRIREIARLVAGCYIESRELLGFPLCKIYPEESNFSIPNEYPIKNLSSKEPFLFEIGCEMLPAEYVTIGQQLLKKGIEDILKKERLNYSQMHLFASPQRLALVLENLETNSQSLIHDKKGPIISIAFDEKGYLTPQGAGFLKTYMIEPSITLDDVRKGSYTNLHIVKNQQNEYLYVKIEEPSKSTAEILKQELPKLLSSMVFPKNMRWSSHNETFARPVRWFCCLLGSQVISFSFAGVHSSDKSRGHAQYSPNWITITSPMDYSAILKDHYVIANLEERKSSILHQLEKIEKQHNAKAVKKERVANEVVNLVEWPKLAVHKFDQHFLEAPKELLVSEMIEHQRYFPLEDENNNLLSFFVMTLDHDLNDSVLDNNKKVLSARLSDGVFLYHQDLKQPLENYVEKLKTVLFQKDLGTIYQKVERLQDHSHLLQHLLKIGSKDLLKRAAFLCKADLVTNLVKEFPDLQGLVGKIYALIQGENQEIADSIQEHWLPNSESGPIPTRSTGIILSLADKLDNIVGYYSVGLRPTSSSDPYALRRQTLGVLKILTRHKLHLSLNIALKEIHKSFSSHDASKTIDEIIEFFKNRCKNLFEEFGYKKDSIEAILNTNFDDPYDALRRLESLENARKKSNFNNLLEVYKRLKGQAEKTTFYHFDLSKTEKKEEVSLASALNDVKSKISTHLCDQDYELLFDTISELQIPLKEMFDNVKILCDDLEIKNNRLALLNNAYSLITNFADFSKLQNI